MQLIDLVKILDIYFNQPLRVQLDIFSDNNLDIFLLYNHYPRSYQNFEDNHDLTIGYHLSKFYTNGHSTTNLSLMIQQNTY